MDGEYVGIDFHRRRSVIVRLNSAGERLGLIRVANDPFEFAAAMADAGAAPQVVIEATYGWVLGGGSAPRAGRDGASG